jgi:hypothetical protein
MTRARAGIPRNTQEETMSIVFDKFPDRKSADRFAKEVKKDFGLDSVVYNDMKEVEAAEEKDFFGVWHPFEGLSFIVHTERACDCDDCWNNVRDKAAIRALAKKMSAEENAIHASSKKTHPWYEPEKTDYFKDYLSCVIEQAVINLAKSFGARWLGT